MTQQSSRLHELERSVSRRASSRVTSRARAATVLRLEGEPAPNGPPASTRAARLPRDLEEQIAVVRGHVAGRASARLSELEGRLTRTRGGGTAVPMSRRYEHATGPVPAPPSPMYVAPVPRAQSLPEPVRAGALLGAFTVESFEEPPIVGSRLIEEAPIRQPASADFGPHGTADPGAAGPQTAPEDRQWEEAVRVAGGAQAQSSAPATSSEAPPPPTRTAHALFDQMGVAMNYANDFDLGAVDLSSRFDQFDKEMEVVPRRAPEAAPAVPVEALALDDFDLVADLTEISDAQAEQDAPTTPATPAAQAPVVEVPPAVPEPPSTSPEPEQATPALHTQEGMQP